MNLQQQPHHEGGGILGMEIIGMILPLTLFSGELEMAEPVDGGVLYLRSVQ